MENSIDVFRKSTLSFDSNNTYVTDAALGYFISIRRYLDEIANYIVSPETGAIFVPDNSNFELWKIIDSNISNLENFLIKSNKNNSKDAARIIDIDNLMIKFKFLKTLFLHENKQFRRIALQLFKKTGNMYCKENIQEIIDMLSESELEHILQIVYQERTLIEKELTGSPIHKLTLQRINEIRKKKLGAQEGDDEIRI